MHPIVRRHPALSLRLHAAHANRVESARDHQLTARIEDLPRLALDAVHHLRAEQLDVTLRRFGERARLRIGSANQSRDLQRAAFPVDARGLARHLSRVRRARIVLKGLLGLVECHQRHRFDQRQRTELGETHLELAVGLVLEDRSVGLENDGAGVERRDYSHDSHARLHQSLSNRRLNRRRAP